MKALRQTSSSQATSCLEEGTALIESISAAISERTGIKLGVEERQMILSRVSSRILTLGLSPQEYELRWSEPKELEQLVSLLTTHHTYFFREDEHFQLLEKNLLPTLVEQLRASSRKVIRVWSAACSRGQEVYTLAAVLERFCKAHAPDLSFELLGTDVDVASVAIAREGVYASSAFKSIPPSAGADFLSSWVVGKGRVSGFLKAPRRWQERCQFQVHNLMNLPPESLGVFDFIFCRNVFIYFKNLNIQKIVSQLLPHLSENGALFIGVSESLRYLDLPVKSVAPSVYVKATGGALGASPIRDGTQTQRRNLGESTRDLTQSGARPQPQQTQKCRIEVFGGRTAPTLLRAEFRGWALKLCARSSGESVLWLGGASAGGRLVPTQEEILEAMQATQRHLGQRGEPDLRGASLVLPESASIQLLETFNRFGLNIEKIKKTAQVYTLAYDPSSGSLKIKPVQTQKIRVGIVDDSASMRAVIEKMLKTDPQFEVVQSFGDPVEAVKALKTRANEFDILTLDLQMPEMSGLQVIAELKKTPETRHLPLVLVSALTLESGGEVLQGLELGAVDYVQKPTQEDMRETTDLLLSKLRAATEARRQPKEQVALPQDHPIPPAKWKRSGGAAQPLELIAIGASTGGTQALSKILSALPEDIPPLLIVQHIPPVFSTAFASRLNEICRFPVREAVHGESVRAGHAYLAPGAHQMRVVRVSGESGYRFEVDANAPKVTGHKPSVDVLFESMSSLKASQFVAVLLTGMGKDGAQGLLKLRRAGSRTLAQDEKTSVVYGMPREAAEIGAAEEILPLASVPQKILDLILEIRESGPQSGRRTKP